MISSCDQRRYRVHLCRSHGDRDSCWLFWIEVESWVLGWWVLCPKLTVQSFSSTSIYFYIGWLNMCYSTGCVVNDMNGFCVSSKCTHSVWTIRRKSGRLCIMKSSEKGILIYFNITAVLGRSNSKLMIHLLINFLKIKISSIQPKWVYKD